MQVLAPYGKEALKGKKICVVELDPTDAKWQEDAKLTVTLTIYLDINYKNKSQQETETAIRVNNRQVWNPVD